MEFLQVKYPLFMYLAEADEIRYVPAGGVGCEDGRSERFAAQERCPLLASLLTSEFYFR